MPHDSVRGLRRDAAAAKWTTNLSELDVTIESPCIGVCRLGDRYCQGCFRTIREIGGWSSYNDEEKLAVLAQLPGRREAAKAD